MDFDSCFDRVFINEGGYQAMRGDRGNWTGGRVGVGELKGTKFGISAMSYPDVDIFNLTREQAKEIYYYDFWLLFDIDLMPSPIRFQLFDAAVNHGWNNTAKILQRALSVPVDGIVGPLTYNAAKTINAHTLQLKFIAERIKFFTKIKTFDEFGKGWMIRMTHNLHYAATDNGE